MIKIGILIGSTRPGRVGESVSRWVFQIAQERKDAEFELVDIQDFNLPLLDEPFPASMEQYSKPLQTCCSSSEVGSQDARPNDRLERRVEKFAGD